MKKCLEISFDPNWMLVTLQTWRDSIDTELCQSADTLSPPDTNHAETLTNFVNTVVAWKMVLRTMKPTEAHSELFNHLVAAVHEFECWAKRSLTILKGIETSC